MKKKTILNFEKSNIQLLSAIIDASMKQAAFCLIWLVKDNYVFFIPNSKFGKKQKIS